MLKTSCVALFFAGGLAILLTARPANPDVLSMLANRFVQAGQLPQAVKPDFLRSLAGVWKAPEYKVKLASDLHMDVFGRDASLVRNVNLTIERSGDATLTVLSSVVDQKGKTIPGSASIEEAKLTIRPPAQTVPGRIQPVVTVVSAERRYPDDQDYRWPLTGLDVALSITALDSNELNLRFNTAEGRGSFGETLRRQRPDGSRTP